MTSIWRNISFLQFYDDVSFNSMKSIKTMNTNIFVKKFIRAIVLRGKCLDFSVYEGKSSFIDLIKSDKEIYDEHVMIALLTRIETSLPNDAMHNNILLCILAGIFPSSWDFFIKSDKFKKKVHHTNNIRDDIYYYNRRKFLQLTYINISEINIKNVEFNIDVRSYRFILLIHLYAYYAYYNNISTIHIIYVRHTALIYFPRRLKELFENEIDALELHYLDDDNVNIFWK